MSTTLRHFGLYRPRVTLLYLPRKVTADNREEIEGANVQSDVFVLIEIVKVYDEQKLAEYQSAARLQIGARGAVVIGRGGSTFVGASLGPLVLQRWPSQEAFIEWQQSAEYQAILATRKQAAEVRIAILPAA